MPRDKLTQSQDEVAETFGFRLLHEHPEDLTPKGEMSPHGLMFLAERADDLFEEFYDTSRLQRCRQPTSVCIKPARWETPQGRVLCQEHTGCWISSLMPDSRLSDFPEPGCTYEQQAKFTSVRTRVTGFGLMNGERSGMPAIIVERQDAASEGQTEVWDYHKWMTAHHVWKQV